VSTSTPQPATNQTRAVSLVVYGIVLHAVLAIALFVLYVWIVPSAKKKCDEFGLTLPRFTQMVIRLSTWVVHYWWSLVPSLVLLGIADFAIIRRLGRTNRTRAKAWIQCTALLLLGVAIVTVLAVEIPRRRIAEIQAR